MSQRSDIRAAIVNNFRNNTDFSATLNVFDSRVDKIPIRRLPAISVYIPQVRSEPEPGREGYVHEEIVKIVCMVKGPARDDEPSTGQVYADELIDSLENEVRTIMLSTGMRQSLGALIRDLVYRGASVSPETESDTNVWFSSMEFSCFWVETLA